MGMESRQGGKHAYEAQVLGYLPHCGDVPITELPLRLEIHLDFTRADIE